MEKCSSPPALAHFTLITVSSLSARSSWYDYDCTKKWQTVSTVAYMQSIVLSVSFFWSLFCFSFPNFALFLALLGSKSAINVEMQCNSVHYLNSALITLLETHSGEWALWGRETKPRRRQIERLLIRSRRAAAVVSKEPLNVMETI